MFTTEISVILPIIRNQTCQKKKHLSPPPNPIPASWAGEFNELRKLNNLLNFPTFEKSLARQSLCGDAGVLPAGRFAETIWFDTALLPNSNNFLRLSSHPQASRLRPHTVFPRNIA